MSWLNEFAASFLEDASFISPIQLPGSPALELDQIYVPLLVDHTREDDEARGLRAFKPKDRQPSDESDRKPAEYLSAVELVNRTKNIIFLGEDGQGKTTFLRYLTLCLLGEQIHHPQFSLQALKSPVDRKAELPSLEQQSWNLPDLLPIYVDVSRLGDRSDLPTDYLSSNADFWTMVLILYPALGKDALEYGSRMLLIDHSEALPEDQWNLWAARLAELSHADDELRIVIASSLSAYRKRKTRLNGFTEERFLPFTSMQKQRFMEKMNGAGSSVMRKGTPAGVHALADIPFHLLLSSLAADNTNDLTLVLDELMQRYFQLAGIPLQQAAAVKFGLGQIAFNTKRLPTPIRVEQIIELMRMDAAEPRERTLALKAFLQTDSFLFHLEETGQIHFRHPLLRDSLIAHFFRNQHYPELFLTTIQSAPMAWKRIAEIVFMSLWNQSQVMSDSLADSVLSLIDNDADERKGMLAYIVAVSLRARLHQIPDGLKHQLQSAMKNILDHGWLTPYERDQAGRILSVLGDTRDLKALIPVPAGEFFLGNSAQPNSAPEHRIHLSAYKIGKYPITIGFFREFVLDTKRDWIAKEADSAQRQNAPAVDVTWFDALEFCAWLTDQWHRSGFIGEDEAVRLPTEAEWEYAARGDRSLHNEAEEAILYPWGSTWGEDRCNSLEMGFNDTCVVGMFPQGASPFGCLDMCGQVWEWTTTLWGARMERPDILFPYQADDGREDLTADGAIRRVLRGGSFSSPFQKTSCTYRGSLEPAGFWRGDGFRIVVAKQ